MHSENLEPITPWPFDAEALKRKHGRIYLIEVENPNGDPHLFVLKQPDRNVLGAAGKVAASDPFKAGVILIENCLVYGDKALLDDVSIFSAVSEQFEEVNKARKATIKNL